MIKPSSSLEQKYNSIQSQSTEVIKFQDQNVPISISTDQILNTHNKVNDEQQHYLEEPSSEYCLPNPSKSKHLSTISYTKSS